MAISRWHYVIGGYLIFYGAFSLVALLLGLLPGLDMSRVTVWTVFWTVIFWMQPLLIVIGVHYILTVRKKAEKGTLPTLP